MVVPDVLVPVVIVPVISNGEEVAMPDTSCAERASAVPLVLVTLITLATVTVPQALEHVAELPAMVQVAAPTTRVQEPLNVVPAVSVAPEADAPDAITSVLEHVPPEVTTNDVSVA